MMHRADDEHLRVPVWRMRQLQAIEDAAREVVELVVVTPFAERSPFEREVKALLEDALEYVAPM
jgi:hypothetical protein